MSESVLNPEADVCLSAPLTAISRGKPLCLAITGSLEICHNLCQLLRQLERFGAKHENPAMFLRSERGQLSPAGLLLLGGDAALPGMQ